MNHLIDFAAHSIVRGVIYRIVWHSPVTVVCVLVVIAAAWIARRYP